MATSDFPNPGGPSRVGTDADGERARHVAIGLLSHRLNGGLNNAVMAFELAVAPSVAGSVPLVAMLRGGLAGAERASRAANLLDVLISDSAPTRLAADEYLSDALELLQDHALRTGCALACAPDTTSAAKVSSTAGDAARALVAGLAAIARGAPGGLRVRFVQREDGPGFDLDPVTVPAGGPPDW